MERRMSGGEKTEEQISTLEALLKSIGLSEYTLTFKENGYDDLKILQSVYVISSRFTIGIGKREFLRKNSKRLELKWATRRRSLRL